MFTARPNALRSAVAIAISSSILPSVKAVDEVNVKVPGYDHTNGKAHERHVTFYLNEGGLPSGRVAFWDEKSAEYKNTLFSNQLKESDFELNIETRKGDDGKATSYTTTLKYNKHEVMALSHELAKGSVKLQANHAVNKRWDSVKKRLDPSGNKASDAKPALLDPLTKASTPTTFGHMLKALKKYATDKPEKWHEGVPLEDIDTYKVSPITVGNTPFLHSELQALPDIDPTTLLQDHALIFPDPEQALSVMATALGHLFNHPKQRQPLKGAIEKLFNTRPPVSFVITELTPEATRKELPDDYPVLTFGGKPEELTLDLEQVNPAAMAWIKEATTGISSGYESLKIVYDNVPQLLEACYHQQAKILRQAVDNEFNINDADTAQLRHYQQLISLLDFVAKEQKDVVFDTEMLETTHIIGEGIGLQAFLAKRFTNVEDLEDIVQSSALGESLTASGQSCCDLNKSPNGDNTYNRLLLHHISSSKDVLQELHATVPDVFKLKGKINRLSRDMLENEITKLNRQAGELSQQPNDNQVATKNLLDSYSSDQVTESDDWLKRVDHPIPAPNALNGFPAPEVVDSITPNELATLKEILRRHNVNPNEFERLIHKLKVTQDWMSVSEDSTGIDSQQFSRIKDIINAPSEGNIDDIANELNAAGQGAALRTVIEAMDDLNELKTLQGDVKTITDMITKQKITPETLSMAYHGATPGVVKMARVAMASSPGYYKQRFLELQEQATKQRAMKILSQSTTVGILADDDSLSTLEAMGNPDSDLYQAVKAVPGALSAGSPQQIRAIYHDLTLVADLTTQDYSENSFILGSLVDALEELREFIDSDGKVIDAASYHGALLRLKLDAYKPEITPVLASSLTPKTLPVYFNLADAIKRQNGKRMVSAGVFEAAYQTGWDAEQFGLAGVLAAIPEVRALAKDAHAVSGERDLAARIAVLEEDYAEFNRLVAGVQQLEQDKQKSYEALRQVKANYRDASQEKVHSRQDLVRMTKKISSAKNFQELESAAEEFFENPRVVAAKKITGLFAQIKELKSHMPSVKQLKAMEQFDTQRIKTPAQKWAEKAGDNDIRKADLLPDLEPLLGSKDKPGLDDIAKQSRIILGPQGDTSNEPLADASALPPKSAIMMVVDAQGKIKELNKLQQKPALGKGDQKRTIELATALGDDLYARHLQLWAGSDDVTTLRSGLKLLGEAADGQSAKNRLNAVFEQQDIKDNLQTNAGLADTVDRLREAAPHIETYKKAFKEFTTPDAETTTYSGALEKTVNQVAKHIVSQTAKHITDHQPNQAPKLVKAALSAVEQDDSGLGASASLEHANNMLKEAQALEKLDSLSKHVAIVKRTWQGVAEVENLQHKAVGELEGFCAECPSGKFLPKGALNGLHKKGVINPKVLEGAKQEFSGEINARKAASSLLEEMNRGEASPASEVLTSHTKLLSVLSDTAEAAIPENFRGVLKLIRDMHGSDPGIIDTLQEMRRTKAFVLGDIPEHIRNQYAQRPQWQWLGQFIAGVDAIGELGENILIQEIVRSDPVTELKLSRKIATNMANAKQVDIQLGKSIEILSGLGDDSERSAALFIKKAMTETGFTMEESPASPETLAAKLKQHYGSSLPDSEIGVMANTIYRGSHKNSGSWNTIKSALDKMPMSGPKLFSGAIKQMMNMNQQMANALLGVNDAFHRWLARSPLIAKMVSAVHRYQLKVEDIEAIRTYQRLVMEEQLDPAAFKSAGKKVPDYPKAANLLKLDDNDLKRLAELPPERWQDSVINIAKDPGKYQASYAVTQTLWNVGDFSTRFILEFIYDDILFYGGTGTIAIVLGYADSTLEKFGLDRDSFLRALVKAHADDLLNPYFQQKVARWVTPAVATYQVKRVFRDYCTYIRPADASAASGALRSIAFFILAEFNDLTWGGPLTKRMALAFRGLDQLVNIQIILDDRIKRTYNKYARGKISALEARHSILQDQESIKLLNKGGDNWQEDCKKVLETLRGDDGITDEDIENYHKYIDSSYSYQNIKKTWQESVATVSTILSKGRPFITPFTSSLPKYMLLSGVVDPMIRYGLNAAAPGTLGALPAKLFATPLKVGSLTLPPTVVGTLAVMGATTAYDGIYNDFETTRQTWQPFAEFIDTHVYGIDFEKTKALGVDKPASWSRTLDRTLPWLSMSAPNNIWRSGLGMFIGDYAASKFFGHKHSTVGYVFRPFTYTYQHIMDHLYNHPEQVFNGTEVPIPEPSSDVRGGTSSTPPMQPTNLDGGSSPDSTISPTPVFNSEANKQEAPTPPSQSVTEGSAGTIDKAEPDRLTDNVGQNIGEPEEEDINNDF